MKSKFTENSKSHHGYVLITCSKPNELGHMKVEMTCKGEDGLIEYLIASAHNVIESNSDHELLYDN